MRIKNTKIQNKNIKYQYVLIYIFIAASALPAYAAPSISSVSGIINDGSSVVLSGDGFGTKIQAPPFKSSYGNPVSSMNFQETGSFDSSYWTLTSPIMITLQDSFKRINSREYVRLEYSSRGNWEGGGYSSGVNSHLGFNATRKHYIAWWDYFEPNFDFSHMSTGNVNIKYIYVSPGSDPAVSLCIGNNGTGFFGQADGGVGGTTAEEQNANLELPFGGYYYSRPLSWYANYPPPKGRWYFIEMIEQYNSAPGIHDGWKELRIDNQRIFKANYMDMYSIGSTGNNVFDNIRFGGNYGFDSSGITQYRYYGDIYIDDEFSRVYLGDEQNFNDCTHLELQIPQQWADGSITFTANQGSFQDGSTVYLFVVDENGEASAGYPIMIGGEADATAPANPRGLSVR